jgi:hypothetical protein
MATLSVDKPRIFELQEDAVLNEIPIIASDTVFAGAAVGDSSGNGRPLVGGDAFMGFATEKCANEGGSAGDKRIKLRPKGYVKLAVTGVASADDHGVTVYATDDDTFTLTPSGASSIGKVHRWIASTTCIVYFEAASIRSI